MTEGGLGRDGKRSGAEMIRLVKQGIRKAGSKGGLAGELGMSKQSSNINKYLRTGRVPEIRLKRLLRFLEAS